MNSRVKEFLEFVRRAPSAFHAAQTAVDALLAQGFERLNEREAWKLSPGKGYFATRNGSSVIAFAIPPEGGDHFQIVASHGDSPAFKLKPVFEQEASGAYIRLNTERYGGMLMSTWMDRPLSIAGRVMVRDGRKVVARLVDLDRDSCLIPNVPIHFNREVNDGYKFNPQVDLLPVYGDAQDAGKLTAEIARGCGAQPEDVVGFDLFLYNRERGSVWGAEDSFFSCPRIDDLECVYASLTAFLEARGARQVNVFTLFDNEEVGSGTKQGADSTFLSDVLSRIAEAVGMEDARGAIASSFMVSADNAHAIHPNHPEKYDADNRVRMNGGVVIKHNANQKYTTDGVSAAIFSEICRAAGVPVQHFTNRSDVAGGSTLGNIANAHASMNTVDIGLAQLAMHSAYETAGVRDLDDMVTALRRFYETEIVPCADGEYELIDDVH